MEVYEVLDETPTQEKKGLQATFAPKKALQDISGIVAAGLKGAAELPARALDIAALIGDAFTPAGQPKLSPEQLEGLRLTPKLQRGFKQLEESVLPPGYLQPQGEIQRFAQAAASEIPGLALTGMGIGNAAKAAFGGELGRTVAENIGFEETGQLLGQLFGTFGANVLTSGGTVNKLKNEVKNKYSSFKKSIPSDLKQSTENVKNVADNIANKIQAGDLVHSEADILSKEIDRVKKLSRTGKIDTEKAFSETQRINKLIRHPETRRAAKEELLNLSRGFRDDIIAAGKKIPELKVQDLLDANDIYYGLYNLSPTRKFLRKWVNLKSLGAIGAGQFVSPEVPSALLGQAGSNLISKYLPLAPLARGAVELGEATYKSPQIRKYIGKVAGKAAAKTAFSRPAIETITRATIGTKSPEVYEVID